VRIAGIADIAVIAEIDGLQRPVHGDSGDFGDCKLDG
jgi:hypothetical protein